MIEQPYSYFTSKPEYQKEVNKASDMPLSMSSTRMHESTRQSKTRQGDRTRRKEGTVIHAFDGHITIPTFNIDP